MLPCCTWTLSISICPICIHWLLYEREFAMTTYAQPADNAEAGPSTSSSSASRLTAGASPYHESSQFKHWRFSRRQLAELRAELNGKSAEVVTRNQALEKVAQSPSIQHPSHSAARKDGII
jgi:cyclin H